MSKKKRPKLSAEEQHVLDHGHVRLLTTPTEIARCDELIREHHYLHSVRLVGEHLRYVFVYKGRWLAVATWSAAAFHLKARDAFIGWSPEQCRRRRGLIANNSRLLVLPQCHYPNLVSCFMKQMIQRLSNDWEQRWGHPLALVETFVDPRFFQGTAYKVSGWSHLGRTAGWKRAAEDFYEPHDTPKQIWVRELLKGACVKLRAPQLPPAWAPVEEASPPRCTAKVAQIRSLIESVRAQVPEFRRLQALGYPVAGLVCLSVMAMAQGVMRGPQDLAEYADTMTDAQLRALGFRTNAAGQVRCPRKTTFSRFLHGVDDQVLERVLLRWQDQLLGPVQDRIVLVDGKQVRHGGVQIVNAVTGGGRFIGSVMTQTKKSNEVPAARQLLAGLELTGKTVVADALHTCEPTARQILYEQGGDYVLTVKGNQPTLQNTLRQLFEPQAFSPSTHSADPGSASATQSRSAGDSVFAGAGAHPGSSRLSRRAVGGAVGDPGQTQGEVVSRSGLFAQQPDP